MKAIHQLLAGFTGGDAISNEAVEFQRIFRSWGYASDIFSNPEHIPDDFAGQAHDVAPLSSQVSQDDVALLHLSIGSPINDLFPQLPCRKALLYHNVTPAHYFVPLQREVARDLAQGQRQVEQLVASAEVVMADSHFNAGELSDMGYRDPRVLPLVLNFDRLKASPDPATLRTYADGMKNVLFVGRCVPNKMLDEVILTFAQYQRFVEPDSRLILAGAMDDMGRYYCYLLALLNDVDVQNVVFAGSVSQPVLNALYQSASLFLCMSEHEGFCIPLIESMVHDVPIVAYAAAAVPETLDGCGVLVRKRDRNMIAEMMGRITSDDSFRQAVIAGQRERLARYRARDLESELRERLAPIL